MPWCPSCESEYDDHVTRCKQCDVDLVEDLEQVVHYQKLVEIDESELEGAIEYLKYSGFEDVKIEEAGDHFDLLVPIEDTKEALKHIRVYFYNLEQEKADNEPDEVKDLPKEYETDTQANASKIKEMRSSASSFIAIGGLLLIFSVLNLLGILKVMGSSMYLYGSLIVSIGFIVIGLMTLKKIPTYEAEITEIEDKIGEMVAWYQENYTLENFYQIKNIDPTQFDEGALYFAAIDVIKGELKGQFEAVEQGLINGAAEAIFSKVG